MSWQICYSIKKATQQAQRAISMTGAVRVFKTEIVLECFFSGNEIQLNEQEE